MAEDKAELRYPELDPNSPGGIKAAIGNILLEGERMRFSSFTRGREMKRQLGTSSA